MDEIKNKNIFEKITLLFEQTELKLFVFLLYFLLLSWPYMSNAGSKSFLFYFIYYFSVWLALIIYLILSRAGEDRKNTDD
jgi:hypothetical protein